MTRRLPLIGVAACSPSPPLPPPAAFSYASLGNCIDAIDAEWQAALDATGGPERHSFSRVTPTSAITMTRDGNTNVTYVITYTCLPDSLRPPEPKGK